MIKKLTYYFLITLLGMASCTLYAQETYKGTFKLTDTITGLAEFGFIERNNEKVYDGPFKFQFAKQFEERFKSISYSGAFSDNKKNGKWIFSSKTLVKSNDLHIDNYEISYSTSGTEHSVISNFKNGKADGDWTVIEQTFENTTLKDTLFYATTGFRDAVMSRQIQAKSQNMSWFGSFDIDGFANGNWIVLHQLDNTIIEEVRVYENGIFKSHTINSDENTFTIEYEGLDTIKNEDENNWEILNSLDQYFDILELSDVNSSKDFKSTETNFKEITNRTNNFLDKAMTSFAYYNDYKIWNRITDKQDIILGKFKVKKFPFTSEERQQISQILKHRAGISQIVNQFFKDPQVEIGQLSFESINRFYAIFEVYRKHSSEIDNLARQITNPSLEYLERSVFIKGIAPTFKFQNQLNYNFKDESFSENYSFPELPLKENFNLEMATIFFRAMHDHLSKEFQNATVVLNDLRKIEALTSLEEELINNKNTIQRLFGNQNQQEDYTTFHQDFNFTVQTFAEKQLKSYVNLSLDEKKQQIDGYLECFEQVINLYDFLADLPLKIASLDELYSRTTFNPYIMVDMEERVKERLYKAYAEIVLPYLIEKMKDEFNFNTISKTSEHIKDLINKMSQLREQDTSVKERQLRRVKDATEVISILELDIN